MTDRYFGHAIRHFHDLRRHEMIALQIVNKIVPQPIKYEISNRRSPISNRIFDPAFAGSWIVRLRADSDGSKSNDCRRAIQNERDDDHAFGTHPRVGIRLG